MDEVTITVRGMSCGHCKNAVEEALNALDGVESAEVDLDAETVAVSYDGLEVEDLKSAITEAGPYEVE
ncbi:MULTISPECIES: cation transporter [unclassified Candidatus Frackibacter]|uniref:cation transporter n=1 Tax=unclassified Candidatus Frackibacter TaxID=2648818 RepID=UPI00079BB59C|nr:MULTISPECIES: cation transporter [unclassified Candidatus Frackibacter]KXS42896.1 MAG: copper ion binding protein [Candidatus Frackibacter sp. T328-2]SDC71017.1 copper chaperone [Candidatus Frackibacter sp. WG11]SEM84545.1 copper chaperone [Candidatus Frackibacter sp. WG12]SFL93733.1 copper chaperone [Candidatus Frackibacter sp. WG13]